MDSKNPWLDLASYKVSDSYRFKGRKSETETFLDIVGNGTMSVLYAKSGIGKTSFINASLIPNLKSGEDEYLPIKILFPGSLASESRASWLVENIKSLEVTNPYDEKKKLSDDYEWCEIKEFPECEPEEKEVLSNSLWWLLHNYELQDKATGKKYLPLLIFDQFEEVFTKTVNKHKDNAQDLSSLFRLLSEIAIKSYPNDILSVLDTVEDRTGEELGIDTKNRYKVIFSLRKEYFPDFVYWTNDRFTIEELRWNRMLLMPLTRQQATSIITEQPVDGESTSAKIDTLNGIKDEILDYIDPKENNEIEPIILSVLCSRLFEIALKKGDDYKLHKDDLPDIKIQNLILDFYNEVIGRTNKENLFYILEDALVDNNGRRNRIKASSIFLPANANDTNSSEKESARLSNEDKLLLERAHIIRTEKYNDDEYVELIHDRLADVIVERRRHRIAQKQREERILANLNRYKSRINILTLSGRRLIDNCGFDFTEDNCRVVNTGLSKRQLNQKSLLKIHAREYNGSDNVFIADMLNQVGGCHRLIVNFGDFSTNDGFNAFAINTAIVIGRQTITEIDFHDKDNVTPIYSNEGISGIKLEYYTEGKNAGRVKYRSFSNPQASVNLSGVTCYEYVDYSDNGLPAIIMYRNSFGDLCRHVDGNYGIAFEYDDCGNEILRRYLDKDGKSPCEIYNKVYGLRSEYDDRDRVSLQYFVDKHGNITEDVYGVVGIRFFYDNEDNLAEMVHVGKDKCKRLSPYGFSTVKISYENGKAKRQLFYGLDAVTPVDRTDGGLQYHEIEVLGYDDCDRIEGYRLKDSKGNVVLQFRYTYDKVGRITDLRFFGAGDALSLLPSMGVHHIKYTYYDNGLQKSLSYYTPSGKLTEDRSGNSMVTNEYDESGKLLRRQYFKLDDRGTLAPNPYFEEVFKYLDEDTCEYYEIRYETVNNKISKQIDRQVMKLNHKLQAQEAVFDNNNNFIPGMPVRVRYKFNIDGDVVEFRFFDVKTDRPIPDNEGDFGLRIDNDVDNGVRRTTYLGEDGEVHRNCLGYVLDETRQILYQGLECTEISFFDENHKPILCTEGFHRRISSQSSYNDDTCRLVKFFGTDGNPCECINGYHEQRFTEIQEDDERKVIVEFFDADGKPIINKTFGFHRRVMTLSDKFGIWTSCSFYDEKGQPVNIDEGFARKTIKRYESFGTYFYYPFQKHNVVRFYDKDDNKVDVKYSVGNKEWMGYRFIVPTDFSTVYELKSAKGKTIFKKKSLLWGSFYYLLVPVLLLFFCIGYPFYSFFKWFFGKLKPKRKQAAPTETKTAIVIAQIMEKLQNGDDTVTAPNRPLGIDAGFYIVKWNDWTYDPDKDVVSGFSNEFNKRPQRVAITFYNPKEEEFLSIDLPAQTLGIRICDTQAPADSVNKMVQLMRSKINN